MRWGVGDLFWVLLAQFGGALVAELVYRAIADVPLDDELSTGAFFWAVLPVSAAASVGALLLISRRKGRGSLRADFGFVVRLRDWTAVLMGVGWQVVLIILLIPFVLLLDSDEPAQELVQEIEETRAALGWAAIVLQVVIIQPTIEEVMFRGILLRSLLRRVAPRNAIVISGLVFGAIHLAGTGLTLAAVPTIVGLGAFGMVLAVLALRHESLSRPILAHVGFNLTVVLLSVPA